MQQDHRYKASIYIFDFDNTLIIPSAKIEIQKLNGSLLTMTTKIYEEYIVEPGDKIDFSGFETNETYNVIYPIFNKLKTQHNSGNKTMILSARGSTKVIEKFKKENNLCNLDIVALSVRAGENNGIHKANYLKQLLTKNLYDYAEFYDDREDCIEEAIKIKKLLDIELRVFKTIDNKFAVERD